MASNPLHRCVWQQMVANLRRYRPEVHRCAVQSSTLCVWFLGSEQDLRKWPSFGARAETFGIETAFFTALEVDYFPRIKKAFSIRKLHKKCYPLQGCFLRRRTSRFYPSPPRKKINLISWVGGIQCGCKNCGEGGGTPRDMCDRARTLHYVDRPFAKQR